MSIASGLVWGYVERWGNKVISLVVFIVLARLLDPSDFGMVAFAKLFIDYLDTFAGQGLGLAIIQRKEVTNDHLNTAFWIIVISGGCLTLLLLLLAPLIEKRFGDPGVANVIRCLAVVLVINSLSRVQIAILTREQRFRALATRGLGMSIAGGAVGVTMAFSGFGVWSLVFQQLTIVVVALAILWGTTTWRPSMSFSFASAKQMYAFASRIVVDQQVLFISKRLDEMLVATFLGVTLLGYYSVAKRLFETLVDMTYSVFSKVLLSVLSKLQDDLKSMWAVVDKLTNIMAAVLFPLFMAGAAVGIEIILFAFSDKWSLAAMPFSVLMLSGILLLTPNVVHIIFFALGRPDLPLTLNIARTIVSAVSISVGSFFGIVGIAWGILICNLVGAILDIFSIKRFDLGNYSRIYRIQVKYFFYCLPMVASIVIVKQLMAHVVDNGVLLGTIFIAGVLVYFLTLVLFKAPVLSVYRDGHLTSGSGKS